MLEGGFSVSLFPLVPPSRFSPYRPSAALPKLELPLLIPLESVFHS